MWTEQDTTITTELRKRRETRYWAFVLIWAGLVFGAERVGILPSIGQADGWSWVFIGAGLLALVGALVRRAAPDRPDPAASLWDFVWAGMFLILGFGPLFPAPIGFPLILLLIGVALLSTSLMRTGRSLS